MKTAFRTRKSAEERREEILDAAVSEFAIKGLHGTSTETIAQRVGISQPYLFRLYGTKKELFLAAVNRGFQRVETAFRRAAAENPAEPLEAMGQEYAKFLAHREELLLNMQSYAACADPDVEALVRTRFARIWTLVEEIPGISADEVRGFVSHGMLLNVAVAMNLPSIAESEGWVQRCIGPT